ncbi:MAG: hypothetical protein ACFFA0_05105 [Promethearchaeota archaeon]
MVIVYGKIKDKSIVKKNSDKLIRCPKCNKEVKIGIELEVIKKLKFLKNVNFPHIYLHGEPIHALLCYLNSELKIRNIGIIESIEISRYSNTFMQFLEKWMNPF